jgi:G6PDH family F420-dependent oxidoreductase
VTYAGRHFDVEAARLWDLPEAPPPIGVAVSGRDSCRLAGRHADLMIGVQPDPELGRLFDAFGGSGKPRVGQVPLSYDRDEAAAVERAYEQFRWFDLGWRVNAELPLPASFAAASGSVRREDVRSGISCGPDAERHAAAIAEFASSGYSHVALVQIGAGSQPEFIEWAGSELLPLVRRSRERVAARG